MAGPLAGLALALAVSLPGGALAQDSTAQGNASASVIQPLTATALEDLSFGAVTVGTSGGTLAVAANGTGASTSGSVRQLCSNAAQCQPHPARFTVSGERDRTYRVSLPDSLEAQGDLSGTSLTVDALTLVSRNRGTADGGHLDPEGEDIFAVGGTLQVPAGTPADTYRAQFDVIVSYD